MTTKQKQAHRAKQDRWLNRGAWPTVNVMGKAPKRWWHWLIFWRAIRPIVVGTRRSGYDPARRSAAPEKKKARRQTQASRRTNRKQHR